MCAVARGLDSKSLCDSFVESGGNGAIYVDLLQYFQILLANYCEVDGKEGCCVVCLAPNKMK